MIINVHIHTTVYLNIKLHVYTHINCIGSMYVLSASRVILKTSFTFLPLKEDVSLLTSVSSSPIGVVRDSCVCVSVCLCVCMCMCLCKS